MIRIVPETGSTNADLLSALRDGTPPREGEWLVADRQTAGRGRQGRNWQGGLHNFMGSTIVQVRPGQPPAHTLSLLTGIALFDTVQDIAPNLHNLTLKWPNDLLVGKAKLAGILLEGGTDAVVIGIGVNLASAPDMPDRETIALTAFGPAPDRDSFAASLAANFATELDRWRTYGIEPLIRRWSVAGMRVGTPVSVHEPNGVVVEGRFDGLEPEGSMRLRLADGTTRAIHAGDVMLAQ
ncbi:MAG: biotin--[acetyl-CoA-carboxylase] ligase [Erythrobacter sp.]|nr:biotin--[acetyl-CoA-carboxylase] ligase [Erythrobacter sp.]NCQ64071.1 biotin--[acetyl-CoA-carboxylase] ligase [Alphaproteobacteria bacterium]